MNYNIIDVSSWEILNGFLKGSKEKINLLNPNNQNYAMFKEPAEGSGDIWSEKISSEIGKLLGFNVQNVDFAIKNEKYGVLVYYSLNIMNEELKEGSDLIEAKKEFDKYQRNGYDFQLIEKILNDYNSNLIFSFLEIVVFDILIGNTDRHSQNWGIIFSKDGNMRIAPAYDNSSSLGREYHSNHLKLKVKLKDENSFKSYCHSKKGSYMIGWKDKYKIPHFNFLELIYELYPKCIKNNILKIEGLTNDKIMEIIDTVPAKIMHDLNKEFAKKILKYRRDYMLEFLKKGV